ncbi:MAG: sugar kinase [Rhizobiales bacterium]|nr:sugar kinase [Hyphomicrobiales bacterium]
MTRIICAGITTLDFIYQLDAMPVAAVKYRSRHMTTSGGGLAGNAATACVRLGAEVSLIARLGDDPPARTMREELIADGVDCSLVRECPGYRSPVSAVMVDPSGERMVVSYSDPDIPADTDWIPSDLGRRADAIYAETRWIEAAFTVLPQARAAGIPSVLDADRRPTRPEVVALASHVGFSETALRELTGIDDLAAALAHAARDAANVLLVTDGPRGAWFMDGDKVVHAPAFPIKAVDTLGAGDTWHGALAVALAERQPLASAVRFANGAAALKCMQFGGRKGMPQRAELDLLLLGG